MNQNDLQSREHDVQSGEQGVAAIWLVLMLGLFMGFAAMAVDLGQWYIARTQVQNATDAAALAGATLLPDNPAAAVAEAERVAVQHGYDVGDVDGSLAGGSQLAVHISTDVQNVFLPAIGFPESRAIGANAIAEYEGNVAMGSPDSQFGNDPERLGESDFIQDDLTLGITAPEAVKGNGDRFHPKICSSSSHSYCSSGLDNDEYREDGYFFTVNVEALSGEDLVIEVFDPAWVGLSGSDCMNGDWWSPSSENIDYTPYNEGNLGAPCGTFYSSSRGLPTPDEALWLTNLVAAGSYTESGESIPAGYYDTAQDRYFPGDNGDAAYWCVGDSLSGVYNTGSSLSRLETTYLVREPDNTPWNHLDNTVISSTGGTICEPARFPAWDFSSSSYDNRVMDLLSPPSGPWDEESGSGTEPDEGQWSVDYLDDVHTFAEYFRRWTPVCRIGAADLQVGEYLLQVRTNASAGDPVVADNTLSTQGSNKFSLRAGFDTPSGLDDRDDVKLSAAGRLPIFVNLEAANAEFFLARVLPTARERTLTIELFDIGESSGSGDYLQILPPDDASSPSVFSDCEFARDGGGTLNVSESTCRLNFSGSSSLNGRVVIIDIPIPDDYNCDETDEDGCWIRIFMDVNGAHDFTTWTAYISGDPVRLIE